MIEITYLGIAGIALLAMFFGYGFGLFEGRGQGYKKRRKEEEIEKANEPPATSQLPAPEPVMVQVDDPGLLRVKNEGGYLTLDLDGSRLDTSALTADQRKRLIEMLTLMRPWLEGKPAAAPVVKSAPLQSQPAPVEGPRETPVASNPAAASQKPATTARQDRPLAPAGSIVSQIDSILQTHLEGTPLAERGIFLAQSPEGGVIVYVGLTKYMGVDNVPDPEIRAAIRSAITEWENKFTPGL